MHARMTRYEGAGPEAIEETLEAKRGVLPTEFGQTEGMAGIVFLVDREKGAVVVISLWRDEEAMRASEDEATRGREEVAGPGETASVERYEGAQLSVEQAGRKKHHQAAPGGGLGLRPARGRPKGANGRPPAAGRDERLAGRPASADP